MLSSLTFVTLLDHSHRNPEICIGLVFSGVAVVNLFSFFGKEEEIFGNEEEDVDSIGSTGLESALNDSGVSMEVLNSLETLVDTVASTEFKTSNEVETLYSIEDYEQLYQGARSEIGAISSEVSIATRTEKYDVMVNSFYNLVTDFYQFGWSDSFHFGPRKIHETFDESLKRAEYYLSSRLGLKQYISDDNSEGGKRPMRALDLGCGIGGPMRNISTFSQCHIEGITINAYQVKVGNKKNRERGLSHCHLQQGDFQNVGLIWPSAYFDAVYQIEATCHSPNRVQTFLGVASVLKRGGLFGGYEWAMRDEYDPLNRDHVRIKEGIEVGNSLPTLVRPSHILECLGLAGFEVLDHFDANENMLSPDETPWYETLSGKWSVSGFRMTRLGRAFTHFMVMTLEALWIAPPGSSDVSALLNATAIDLVEAGKCRIFTPSYFFLARKK